jgi:hypothetical protein
MSWLVRHARVSARVWIPSPIREGRPRASVSTDSRGWRSPKMSSPFGNVQRMTRWDDVDEPVLRWLAGESSSFIHAWQLQLTIRPDPPPSDEVAGLSERQVDEALTRLGDHGLIDGNRMETIGYSVWSRLRVTGLGQQVLGEWPELDRLNTAEGLRLLLAKIAEQSSDADEQADYRRAVGFLTSIGDGIIDQTLMDVAGAGVDDLKDEL